MSEGLLDTNVFIHAHTCDAHSASCRALLAGLEVGRVRARIEPLILHELSYALPHYLKQMGRAEVAEYLLMILGWEGVRAEIDLLVDTVERWRDTGGLSFADAYLAALAVCQRVPVFTVNVRELRRQGATVPSSLPS